MKNRTVRERPAAKAGGEGSQPLQHRLARFSAASVFSKSGAIRAQVSLVRHSAAISISDRVTVGAHSERLGRTPLGTGVDIVGHAVFGEEIAAAGKLEYMIGAMIEIPRAALTADKVATETEFFGFGANDLT